MVFKVLVKPDKNIDMVAMNLSYDLGVFILASHNDFLEVANFVYGLGLPEQIGHSFITARDIFAVEDVREVVSPWS